LERAYLPAAEDTPMTGAVNMVSLSLTGLPGECDEFISNPALF
jgi:hypothetical protein